MLSVTQNFKLLFPEDVASAGELQTVPPFAPRGSHDVMEMGGAAPSPQNICTEVVDFFPLPVLLLATDSMSDLLINFKI